MIKLEYKMSADPCKGNYLPAMKATSIHKIGLSGELSAVLEQNRIKTFGDLLVSLKRDPHWIPMMEGVTAQDMVTIIGKLKTFGFDVEELRQELFPEE